MRVADCYQHREMAYTFIVDLMKLNVPGLFSVLSSDDKPAVTEFEEELRWFILKNGQKFIFFSNTEVIMLPIKLE